MRFWREGEGVPEPVRRREVEAVLQLMKRLPPSELKSIIDAYALQRVLNVFRKQSFAIVSAYRETASRRKNFKRQYQLLEEIRKQSSYPFCHIGFWDEMPNRCIFVPRVDLEQARVWSKSAGQKRFIWGEKGEWMCCDTRTGDVVANGQSMNVIGPDEEIVLYCKVAAKKASLQVQLDGITKKHATLSDALKSTVDGLRRHIRDLGRIEDDILECRLR